MKKLLITSYFWGLALVACGQILVTGKVVDKHTHQPVPYASVVVVGTTTGTTSNADGDFALSIRTLPARVLAFSLGYGRDSMLVAVAGSVLALALVPAPIQLPTVEPASYAATLLARAYRQLQRTRLQAEYGQAFYRQVTRNDQQPTEVLEAVWDVKTNSSGVAGTRLAQGRYAQRPALMNFTNFSLYTKVCGGFCGISAADTVASHAVVGPDAQKFYTLQFKGLTLLNGQQLAEITFVSLPGIPAVSGSIFIDADTYQVLHARATRPLTMNANKKGYLFKEAVVSVEADFKPQPDGAALHYVKVSSSLTASPPHKPDVPVRVESFAFFYDGRPIPTGLPYAGPEAAAGDLAAIKQKAYDPTFWRDNSVIKRTPLEEEIIRSFEQNKSFGTLITKQ